MKWLEALGFKAGNRTILMTIVAAGLSILLGMSDAWDPMVVTVLESTFVIVLASVPIFLRKAITNLQN